MLIHNDWSPATAPPPHEGNCGRCLRREESEDQPMSGGALVRGPLLTWFGCRHRIVNGCVWGLRRSRRSAPAVWRPLNRKTFRPSVMLVS